MRKAGQEHQQLDAVPLIYLDEHGRYLPEQRPPDPPDAGDESATLVGFLERQRATFAWKCSGLDAAGLKATVGASSMTLGGMLKHLACFEDDMVRRVAARAGATCPVERRWTGEADPAWDWRSAAADTPEQLYALWQDAVARSRALLTKALAEGGPERRGGAWPDGARPACAPSCST